MNLNFDMNIGGRLELLDCSVLYAEEMILELGFGNTNHIKIYIYVRRKVRIGTISELSYAKWEFSLCPPIPELYRTILELRKGYRLYIDWVYVPAQ